MDTRGWRDFGRGLLDLFFEPRCLLCAREASLEDPWLCADHSLVEVLLAGPRCPRCTRSLVAADAPCPSCAEQPPPWQAAVAALSYAGPGRELLLRAKLGGRREALRPLAERLAPLLLARGWEPGTPFVPVPLHRRRRFLRGFNQAEVIARELAEILGGRVDRVLRRTRATAPQGDPLTTSRRRNVEGAFAARASSMPARAVLVDDVWTSGATLRACTRALRSAGCREVWVAAVFRAR